LLVAVELVNNQILALLKDLQDAPTLDGAGDTVAGTGGARASPQQPTAYTQSKKWPDNVLYE
jgi:hypothetical protein